MITLARNLFTRLSMLAFLLGFILLSGSPVKAVKGPTGGNTTPVLYYEPGRKALVAGPLQKPGDVVEVLNIIGQRIAIFPLSEGQLIEGRLYVLSVGHLPEGLYYARWLSGGEVVQVRRFVIT